MSRDWSTREEDQNYEKFIKMRIHNDAIENAAKVVSDYAYEIGINPEGLIAIIKTLKQAKW